MTSENKNPRSRAPRYLCSERMQQAAKNTWPSSPKQASEYSGPPNKNISEISDSSWSSLYTVGGIAALIAGVIFRRNISAEITLFGAHAPDSLIDWFALLQNNRLLKIGRIEKKRFPDNRKRK